MSKCQGQEDKMRQNKQDRKTESQMGSWKTDSWKSRKRQTVRQCEVHINEQTDDININNYAGKNEFAILF